MRCCALVQPEALEIRSSDDLTRRCQRNGKRKLGTERFCYQHLPEELKVHDRIVARIRAIPTRDITSL
jgi:hypothetical protein